MVAIKIKDVMLLALTKKEQALASCKQMGIRQTSIYINRW